MLPIMPLRLTHRVPFGQQRHRPVEFIRQLVGPDWCLPLRVLHITLPVLQFREQCLLQWPLLLLSRPSPRMQRLRLSGLLTLPVWLLGPLTPRLRRSQLLLRSQRLVSQLSCTRL